MDTQDTSVCHSTVLLVHHTILCILRSKDIAPRHGIAHGRTGRDNVHAPEAMTLPMCVKATGALGKKKGRGGHAWAPHPAPTTLPSSPASANTYTDIPKPNRAYRPHPLREATSPSSSSPLSLFLPSTPLLAPRRLVFFPSVSARRRSTPPPDLGFHSPF
jgi:hypothetical protein